jgi:hypothetical protein
MIKLRTPTDQELADALCYIEREFVIRDGLISGEHWAEGLAMHDAVAYFPASADHIAQVRAVRPQLSESAWIGIAERADYLRFSEAMAPRFSEVIP